jgi:hypothetical protein
MAKIRINGIIDIGDLEICSAIASVRFIVNTALGNNFEGIVADEAVLDAEHKEKMTGFAKEFSEAMSKVFWNDQI